MLGVRHRRNSPVPKAREGPMSKRSTRRKSFVMSAATAAAAAMSLAPFAGAAVVTWNGGGGDSHWTTANNWGGTAPVAGDALIFAGATSLNPNDDFANGTIFNGITFNAGAGSFTVGSTGGFG